MAYREKIAWMTLICMVVAYSIYFPLMILRPTPPGLFDILWTFGTIASIQGVVAMIAWAMLAVRYRSEARVPADERDRRSRGAGRMWPITC